MKFAMIAGNGRFPILALEAARQAGHEVTVIALKEEASAEVEKLAERTHWISLGQLGKLIDIMHQEQLTQLIMCGQVKHAKLFSGIVPDWRLMKLLASLATKNTDSLIGGVQQALAAENIHLLDSTLVLKPLLATEGAMTRRRPSREEEDDIQYGRRVAAALSAVDIGQSVAISEKACVAVEAMEGTDAMLQRAAALVEGRPLRLVKASGRRRHLLFDVPVAGPGTIATMRQTGCTALAVDAGRTLLLDRQAMLREADAAGIAVAAYVPAEA
jgi:UDP-2,3-diacylglucosamine hydrolase